ncbi:Mg2+ transporter protein CorA-like/Zinc transport protein ZntB [Penicillium expansum]|nr:Mg2+ transporter protein CorA-like/Zinc transport protein ZntB [Penicillium expansum]
MQADTGLYLIQRMYQYTQTLTDKSVGRPGCAIYDQQGLFVKLENTRGWYLGLVAQCDYLIRRTSAQTETR